MEKLLLISSSEVGQRCEQHKNVIMAARETGVKLLVYTSILHADTSPLPLKLEHMETEKCIQESGLPAVILRNGWYTENYAASIPVALEHGALFGCAGEGKISSAARADYAAAAAKVLLADNQAGKIYELAGDESYTLKEFAEELLNRQVRPWYTKTFRKTSIWSCSRKQDCLDLSPNCLQNPITAPLKVVSSTTASS